MVGIGSAAVSAGDRERSLPAQALGLGFSREYLTSVRCPETKPTPPKELHPRAGPWSSLPFSCTSAVFVSIQVEGPLGTSEVTLIRGRHRT